LRVNARKMSMRCQKRLTTVSKETYYSVRDLVEGQRQEDVGEEAVYCQRFAVGEI
jgi:hypothetical protein